ncbi:DNA excision repair protein ERCC-6-like [Sycon ciliatum]|uniref:DNA excision repair protein ERCC-6-like n=1 Tax=Sycon ciliatum TaxID=27933 RepID=UPI0031F6A791
MNEAIKSAGPNGAGETAISDEDRVIFSRLVRDGKKYASEGELSKALSCLTLAYDIRPTERIQKHITKIQAALDEYSGNEDEDEAASSVKPAQHNEQCQSHVDSVATEHDNGAQQATTGLRDVNTRSDHQSSDHISVGMTSTDSMPMHDRQPRCEEKPRKRALMGRNAYVMNEAPSTSTAEMKDSRRSAAGKENAWLSTKSRRADDAIEDRRGGLKAEMAPNGVVLRSVWDKLYAHQRKGVQWLLDLHEKGCGGILADDMGLGKTVQITVYLASLVATERIHSALVMAPVSVLTAWQKEIKKWYPSLRLGCFHGTSKKQREMDLERVQKRGGVCLTTYGMVRSGLEDLTCHGSFAWDCLVLDEGHMIRNNNKTTKQIYSLLAKQRLILTGTPIMNRLEELWRLFDFATNGNLFGPLKDFKEKYEQPIVQSHSKSSTEAEKENGASVSDKLQRRIAPFMMRRTKAEVMEEQDKLQNAAAGDPATLPSDPGVGESSQSSKPGEGDSTDSCTTAMTSSDPAATSSSSSSALQSQQLQQSGVAAASTESAAARMAKLGEKRDLIVWVHLSHAQLKLYLNFVTGSKVQEALMEQRSALPKLMLLKKITDHPALLSDSEKEQLITDDDDFDTNAGYQGDYVESESEDEIIDDSQEPGYSQTTARSSKTTSAKPWLRGSKASLVQSSGKISVLLPLLEVLKAAGHRVLIFSQMTKMLDIVEAVMRWKNIHCLRLDGRVKKVADRQRIIDKFSQDKKYTCFLLTTQVGGVGLTLTAADRVIIVDPSWNPAVDAQAVDRAYRIGQQRSVVVYRLITCGTIEEKIYRKQVFKDSVNQQVTGDSSQPLRYFTSHELHNLFMLDNPWQSTTQERLSQLEDTQSVGYAWLQNHRQFFSSLGVVQGLSEHHLQLNVVTDEDFWDENKLVGTHHSESVLQKHRHLTRAKRHESHGNLETALVHHLKAVKLDPSDLRVQFRCLQLTAQLGLWH